MYMCVCVHTHTHTHTHTQMYALFQQYIAAAARKTRNNIPSYRVAGVFLFNSP